MRPRLIQFALSVEAKVDRMTPPDQEIADSLGLELGDIRTDGIHPLLVTREQTYLVVPLRSLSAVRTAEFNAMAWSYTAASSLMISQVLLFSEETEEAQHDFHGRLMGPDIGVHEDPPIGISIPVFAAYLANRPELKGAFERFKIERGTLDTRQSVLTVETLERSDEGLKIEVGGPAISISQGSMLVPEVDLVG